jgi:hypothetical protein
MSAGTADRSVAEIRQPAGDGSAAGYVPGSTQSSSRPRKEMGSSTSGSGKPAGGRLRASVRTYARGKRRGKF